MPEQLFPEPCVGSLIFNKQGKVFLMKSPKWHDHWIIPGGHIELGETMEQALKREIKEETGLDIYDIKFVLFQEFINDPIFWKKKHFVFFDFACKTNSTKVTLEQREGKEYVWATIEEAMNMKIDTYTKKLIETQKKRDYQN